MLRCLGVKSRKSLIASLSRARECFEPHSHLVFSIPSHRQVPSLSLSFLSRRPDTVAQNESTRDSGVTLRMRMHRQKWRNIPYVLAYLDCVGAGDNNIGTRGGISPHERGLLCPRIISFITSPGTRSRFVKVDPPFTRARRVSSTLSDAEAAWRSSISSTEGIFEFLHTRVSVGGSISIAS